VRQLSNRHVVWKIKGLSAIDVAVHYGAGFCWTDLEYLGVRPQQVSWFHRAGRQAQNTHIESFNGKFRDEWQQVSQACEQA
jgi:hypothetical protein